jgi:zinc D-Ala-D-Ala carboxypeptidase
MTESIKLSEHFTLDELTLTSRLEYQAQNRILDDRLLQNLRNVAGLLEAVRDIVKVPIKATSGYRCHALNLAEGSSDRSQHLKGEAADIIPIGIDIGDAFRAIWRQVSEHKLEVGQLIFETAVRSYGVASWIHVSLGSPWREQARCNQVLRMENGVYKTLGVFKPLS